MATSIDTRQTDFSEMDNAGISKEHWKIMFISGMGFFTDAYDLFIIGVVMALLKPMWHVGKVEEGLVESTALLAAAIGALLFGRVADMVGRKRIYGVEVLGSRRGRNRLCLLSQHLVAHRVSFHSRHWHWRRLSCLRHHYE
jgi:PHS family inorganic phosphate transporter-like MFS transporter